MIRKKRCNKNGCREFVEELHEAYCKEHIGEVDRQYNEFRNKYDKEYVSFYSSKKWRDKRLQALRRDEYLCKDCLKDDVYTVAEEVHHIIETKDDWSKRLELDNLISLCKACHNKRHER
ncbi:HNH endonuclease [Corticicoccus populi]|uniref:Putative HNH nuclease YajD n=1 Tax=Corticicoccus populi TaxID=1812821 RepID=A0ABW5WSI4_9STAP